MIVIVRVIQQSNYSHYWHAIKCKSLSIHNLAFWNLSIEYSLIIVWTLSNDKDLDQVEQVLWYLVLQCVFQCGLHAINAANILCHKWWQKRTHTHTQNYHPKTPLITALNIKASVECRNKLAGETTHLIIMNELVL